MEIPELTGDERDMHLKHKRYVYFCLKWRKKYEFDGSLDVERLELMIRRMRKTCGDKADKQQAEGLDTARVWLTEARKRAERENK